MEKQAQKVFDYFPDLDERQRERILALGEIYRRWNEQINVVSRKDIDNLYVKHVLHSLGIARVCQFVPGTKVLDVGTGGGFPGIPLAIVFPEVEFCLVDSIGKKIKVVKAVAEELGLENVRARQARAEDLQEKYDFVVSRAVTRMEKFYGWVRDKIRPGGSSSLKNGILYLKGGDLQEEMKELGKPYEIFELEDYFQEEFFESKKVVYVCF